MPVIREPGESVLGGLTSLAGTLVLTDRRVFIEPALRNPEGRIIVPAP